MQKRVDLLKSLIDPKASKKAATAKKMLEMIDSTPESYRLETESLIEQFLIEASDERTRAEAAELQSQLKVLGKLLVD